MTESASAPKVQRYRRKRLPNRIARIGFLIVAFGLSLTAIPYLVMGIGAQIPILQAPLNSFISSYMSLFGGPFALLSGGMALIIGFVVFFIGMLSKDSRDLNIASGTRDGATNSPALISESKLAISKSSVTKIKGRYLLVVAVFLALMDGVTQFSVYAFYAACALGSFNYFHSTPAEKQEALAKLGRNPGLIVTAIGIAVLFSPILFAYLATAPGGNMYSESGSGNGGSAIWLMYLTIPLGGFIMLIGLVISLVNSSSRKTRPASDEKPEGPAGEPTEPSE